MERDLKSQKERAERVRDKKKETEERIESHWIDVVQVQDVKARCTVFPI